MRRFALELVTFFSYVLVLLVEHFIGHWDNVVIGLFCIVLEALFGLLIFYFFVIQPVQELVGRAQAVLEGDLTQDVAVK